MRVCAQRSPHLHARLRHKKRCLGTRRTTTHTPLSSFNGTVATRLTFASGDKQRIHSSGLINTSHPRPIANSAIHALRCDVNYLAAQTALRERERERERDGVRTELSNEHRPPALACRLTLLDRQPGRGSVGEIVDPGS